MSTIVGGVIAIGLAGFVPIVPVTGPPAAVSMSPALQAPQVPASSLRHAWQQQQEQAQRPEPVDINKASEEELQKVPGIGPALARRIVEFRQEHGAFEKVDDLLNVRGIGTASLEKLKPFLTVKPKQ